MLDDIFDFFFTRSLATIATLLIGCYILRDTVRTCVCIFESSRRHSRRRPSKTVEDRVK